MGTREAFLIQHIICHVSNVICICFSAKLPGGGRKGAAVLCELIPGQLAPEPGREAPGGGEGVGGRGGGYPQGGGGGRGRRPPNYPSDGDGGYPDTPYYRRGGQ